LPIAASELKVAERPPRPASGDAPVSTQLHGRRLAVARALWLALILAGLGVFAVAVPVRFQELATAPPDAAGAALPLGLSPEAYALYICAVEAGFLAAMAVVAGIIFWRRSDDWLGLLVSAMLVLFGAAASTAVDTLFLTRPDWRVADNLVQTLGLGGALLATALFPDGRFVPRWVGLAAVVWVAWAAVWLVAPDVPFNPVVPNRMPLPWYGVHFLWFLGGLLNQVYRYRRVAGPIQRQQTKWIVFGIAIALVVQTSFNVARVLFPALAAPGPAGALFNLVVGPLRLLALLVIPFSVMLSILRYGLWQVDTVINRTLVYGGLTLSLLLVYLGSVAAFQGLFRAAIGQRSNVAVVLSTLLTAALFLPLRDRLQVLIDRRFYRRKYDAARTLAAFSAEVRDEVDLNRLALKLARAVEDTVQPAHLSLWVRPAPKPEPDRRANRR
jgi:hypothetical protein